MTRKKKVKYECRQGGLVTNEEDAQIVGETLDELAQKKGGEYKTEDVIKHAKKKTSPLHKFFEWDDEKASEQYRLVQARKLVASVVQVVVVEGKQSKQRSFHSVVAENKGKVFVNLNTALKNDDYRSQLLDKIIRHLENSTVTMKMFRDL